LAPVPKIEKKGSGEVGYIKANYFESFGKYKPSSTILIFDWREYDKIFDWKNSHEMILQREVKQFTTNWI
jgi:hypothetical protein